MFTSTITRKGQVTIPKRFRDSLRLRANDKVIFVQREDALILKPVKGIRDLRGIVNGEASPDLRDMRDQVKRRIAGKIADE